MTKHESIILFSLTVWSSCKCSKVRQNIYLCTVSVVSSSGIDNCPIQFEYWFSGFRGADDLLSPGYQSGNALSERSKNYVLGNGG